MPDTAVIILSDDDSESDVEIVEFRRQTQQLLEHPKNEPEITVPHQANSTTKRLADIQCPICFDDLTRATTTACGHVFCLECISQSIASSHARGQVRGRRGTGLCPLCRKPVAFKDTILLKMRKMSKSGVPELPPKVNEEEIKIPVEEPERKRRKVREPSEQEYANEHFAQAIADMRPTTTHPKSYEDSDLAPPNGFPLEEGQLNINDDSHTRENSSDQDYFDD